MQHDYTVRRCELPEDDAGQSVEVTTHTDIQLASVPLADADDHPRKQADIIVDIGRQHELFHDAGGDGYASLQLGDHVEVHALASTAYRELLAHCFFELTGKGCNRNSLVDALTTLSAAARFRGATHAVRIRTADADGDILIDLGTPDWQSIRVTKYGWRVEHGGAVKFRRTPKQSSLPIPTHGDFSLIWDYLNVGADDRVLTAAFMLIALRPAGPYPALMLSGEQGTGKSTFCKLLKALIDPSEASLRSPPKEVRDLLVGALNSWLLCMDNLSYLPAQLSDALCRLSTGGAINERTLYSNLEETLVEVHRPTILNGISELATRPDLAERGIHIELEQITSRRTEADLWRSFQTDASAIFAGLLDGLALALRELETTHIERLPRMADFALWAEAGLPALGFERGEFMKAYSANQNVGLNLGLESSVVGQAIKGFMGNRVQWMGTATDLLQNLESCADENTRRAPAWPKCARSLRSSLNRLGPALRAIGVQVEHERNKEGRLLTLSCRVGNQPSRPSQLSSMTQNDANDGVSGGLHNVWGAQL
jgi:energy-coupling factor transporter ATP-binding protein EcfA2